VAQPDLHSLALSFARWRDRVPPAAVCVTAPAAEGVVALPVGLQRWLRRTSRGPCRVAFSLGDAWWAYDLVDVTRRRGSTNGGTQRFFVIASSDRHDPEWGADHEFHKGQKRWTLCADIPELTRRRLSALPMKA
jgi:hypothetical protein